jgi:8-oxo-dGTP diphosphatase
MAVIPAAGTLPWQRVDGALQVALVHRPKYNDWAWTKGKLDEGEDWPVAAVRETLEETGLAVHLGQPVPSTTYTVVDRLGHLSIKQVRYWAAQVVGGAGALEHEIDEVAWLDIPAAMARLDYARDRDQLRALVRAEHCGALDTWPLVIVRHGRARSRSSWSATDALRPLDKAGLAQAQSLVPLLAAYGVSRVVSSSSTRCVDSVAPYARSIGARVRLRDSLTEEMYAAQPAKAVRTITRLLDRAEPTAVCSHGPVLPSLFRRLHEHVADPEGVDRVTAAQYDDVGRSLLGAADLGLAKGEVVVCHLSGVGAAARVVAVERHRGQG